MVVNGIGKDCEGIIDDDGEDKADTSNDGELYNGSNLEVMLVLHDQRGERKTCDSLVHGAWTALKPGSQARLLDFFMYSFGIDVNSIQVEVMTLLLLLLLMSGQSTPETKI
jgi:hypothetical protein